MEPSAGALVARRFRLVRELGRGTMGTVWLADHKTLGLRCAVKFTTAEAERDPAYRERFEREARAVAQLDCPNVVRVLDYDVFEGVPFIAMEWLAGEDLETRLLRVGRLGARDVHRIVTQVAQGLESAHAAGIIHRDLKPGNVFLATSGSGEVAKILDFGLAKLTSCEGAEAMTQAGSVLGTPLYMSPEQARTVSDIDHRSDLWSLAVIAYECLLGTLPFNGPSLGEVFARIMFEPIPVPSAIDPRVPLAFDLWWKRATCREVEGRFASAREMADALGRALAVDEGHPSRPDLASSRTVPPPPRRRARWLVAMATVTFVIAGVQFLPDVSHFVVPPRVRDPVRSAARAIGESMSRMAAQAEAAMPYVSPDPSAWLDPSAAPAAGASPADPAAHPATTTPAWLPTLEAPRWSPAVRPPSSIPSAAEAQARSAGELAASTATASGVECRIGQHRCDGRVLQICNQALDGWADVTLCPSSAVCDATGPGGCASPGAEALGGSPSELAAPRL